MIGPHVTLSAGMVAGQACLTDPVVRIGDRCLLGRGSGVVGHLSIEIEDDVWTGHHVYITDQNHGYADLKLPISRQAMPERPVRIGAGSWLGHGTVVLPGTTIGRHVVIGANSVVRGEIPSLLRRGRQPGPRRQTIGEPSVQNLHAPLTVEWFPADAADAFEAPRAMPWQFSVSEIAGRRAARHLVVAGELLELLADRNPVDGRLRERLVGAGAQPVGERPPVVRGRCDSPPPTAARSPAPCRRPGDGDHLVEHRLDDVGRFVDDGGALGEHRRVVRVDDSLVDE